MAWRDRASLTGKGFLMGLADVIPGVSGGTMALILGIYVQFIEGIKSINVRFLKPLLGWVFSGFKRDRLPALKEALQTIHIGFLIFLGMGIVSAFVIGSKVIPGLLERYPTIMRGFFFGLIVASVYIPYKLMKDRGFKEASVAVLFCISAFFLVGLSTSGAGDWGLTQVAGTGGTLEELVEDSASSVTPAQLLVLEANRGQLASLAAANNVSEAELVQYATSSDVRHTSANDFVVPAGLELSVPRPPGWWIFLCGVLAICAMVLPGVSGSFLLLALGSYYFMLNTLKGFISSWIHISPSGIHTMYVGIFLAGVLLGLVVFSRVLSYLFRRFPSATLAAMVGLMIGSLRAIWPFKDPTGGNVLPEALDSGVTYALLAFVGGACLVMILNFIGRKRDQSIAIS